MIINFIINNYKSIKGPIYIDFTNKEQRIKDEEQLLFKEVSGNFISRLNFFYGKNGSGKSKIIEALKDLKEIVINPRMTLTSSEYAKDKISPFLLSGDVNYDSFLSVTFSICYNIYRYSILIDTKKKIIKDERLEMLFGEERLLFSTKMMEYPFLTTIEEERLNSYKQEKRSTLDILNNEFNLNNIEFRKYINNAYQFFDELNFSFQNYNTNEFLKTLYEDDGLLNDLVKQLKGFDLGIENIQITNFDELLFLPKENNDYFRLEEKAVKGYNESYEMKIIYKGKSLDIHTQSTGTRKIINILFSLYNTKRGVYIIDDFEKDIHNEVAIDLIKYLAKNKENLQFIFTTHELEFLNLTEVHNKALHYFVEKDNETLSTEIIYLSQFADLRSDDRNSWESFYKKHRLGQYPDIKYSKTKEQ